MNTLSSILVAAAALAGLTTGALPPATGSAPSDELDIACTAWFERVGVLQSLDLAAAFGEDVDVAARYADDVLPLTHRFAAHAPDELADAAAATVAGDETVAATGERGPVGPPDDSATAIVDYLFANCAGTALEVTLSDYDFEGVPDTVPAGRIVFRAAVPEHAEWHEMTVLRLDGPLETVLAGAFEALATDPMLGPRTLIEALGGAAPADTGLDYSVMPVYTLPVPPGGVAITGGNFEPGEYAAVCAFGEGSTSLELIAPRLMEAITDPDVHSHAELGMLHTFTVE